LLLDWPTDGGSPCSLPLIDNLGQNPAQQIADRAAFRKGPLRDFLLNDRINLDRDPVPHSLSRHCKPPPEICPRLTMVTSGGNAPPIFAIPGRRYAAAFYAFRGERSEVGQFWEKPFALKEGFSAGWTN
jgi:hypothetical protein